MDTATKVTRILSTRLGTRPGHPLYGSRMYLLRDKRADGEASVWFAKYAHEDITRSDPSLMVKEAKFIEINGDQINGRITLHDETQIPVEVQL